MPAYTVLAFSHMFKSFFELMKPRVMSLVIFTALVGMVIAPTQPALLDASFSLFFVALGAGAAGADRKSTRLNSSHDQISYAVFCLKKKKKNKKKQLMND